MTCVLPARHIAAIFRFAFLPLCLAFQAKAQAWDEFQQRVEPYIQKYCIACHGPEEARGDLDLTQFKGSADVIASFRRWTNVVEFIQNGEMPPKESLQPSLEESSAVVSGVREILITEAEKQAGDPGIVLPRRLSNTEYDRSIHDLTGIDIRPTRDFPADPAAGEGFDNTGEALGMSPNLLKKYLSAAQLVSDHLVLKTTGLSFAPYPVTSYNERKKFTEQAIIDFYQSHAVDTVEYLDAAWRFRYRPADQQHLTIDDWAASRNLSPRYLMTVWTTLNSPVIQSGPLIEFGVAWNNLPAPLDATSRPEALLTLQKTVEFYRRLLHVKEPELIQANAGNWPIAHLDFRARVTASRDKFSGDALKTEALLNSIRIAAPAPDNSSPQSVSIIVQLDPAFTGSVGPGESGTDVTASGNSNSHGPDSDGYVVIHRPMFSNHDRLPNNAAEEEQQGAQTLRSVLEASDSDFATALNFGKHPSGQELDPDSFVLKSPRTLEIPLTVDMQRQLNGKRFLLTCRLDMQQNPQNGVFIRCSLQKPSDTQSDSTELLMNRDSESAKALTAAASDFCQAFPNRFFYVDSGRGLAAGFHLVEGFFRDDRPLVEKVLSDDDSLRLDLLWRELDFVTESHETLLRGFVWFERSEREVLLDKRFDFLQADDPALVGDSMLDRFEKQYLDKMGVRRRDDTLEPETPDPKAEMIHRFFTSIREGLAQHHKLMPIAEQRGLADLDRLTQRAFRRTLQPRDRESLQGLYRKLRSDGLDVETALRGLLTAILMSPDFCYQYHNSSEGSSVSPLSDDDLASRLSFFLWSSLPDDELLIAAAAGKLQDERELVSQTQRMLKDHRTEAFAREFFGQWLRYRDYLTKDPINAEAFSGYDDQLRSAIAEEPVKLATYLIQTDQPITQLLTSDTTFVNRRLAQHYGQDFERRFQEQHDRRVAEAGSARSISQESQSEWYPVKGLRQAGRGGLFGMAIVLTKNSAGERTSPVKRGFWSVHHLLGQHFPPPPADVPELPKSEKGADRTIRELLALHVADQQCAMCHRHFDGLGVAMEGFDAIGRRRTDDSAGRPIDDLAVLPNGNTAAGIPGLIDYIDQNRRDDFVRTLCRRFLGYALGRSVSLSDQLLLDEMERELKKNDFRFSVLFDSVVRSPQFRQQRGPDFVTSGR